MDKTTTAIVIGVVALALIGGVFAGVAIGGDGIQQNDSQDVEQDEPANESSEPVNESEVPQVVSDSEAGATDLKRAFVSEYDYENRVMIQDTGQVVLYYNSDAASGNNLKDQMKQVGLLYADVAAENPDMGALTIRANGVMLTIPADTAIAHGNGDINEEAYFENVRFESTNSTSS